MNTRSNYWITNLDVVFSTCKKNNFITIKILLWVGKQFFLKMYYEWGTINAKQLLFYKFKILEKNCLKE